MGSVRMMFMVYVAAIVAGLTYAIVLGILEH
jgi:hypothetical protein